jgi:carotenoid cleavage dioxygenase-like enzyme
MQAEVRQENFFLTGNFAPVKDELDVEDLPVTFGKIPEELNGWYLRNGPNPQFEPIGKYHWFDGDGMIHGVKLEGGKASYRNRWVLSAGLLEEREAGRALYPGLAGFDPSEGLDKIRAPKLVANTNVIAHSGKVLALVESGPPTEITLPDLKTIGPYDFCGKLISAMTAHPKEDFATGELFFFGYSALAPTLVYYVVSPDGDVKTREEIGLWNPVMIHDFQITKNYAIFLEAPAVFDISRFLRGEPILRFDGDLPARIGVMPRYGPSSAIQWFEVPTCYVFHFLNGFEKDGKVVIEACRMENLDLFALETGTSEDTTPKLFRWELDLASGTISGDYLDDRAADFPRIDPRLVGSRNRYGYFVATESADQNLLNFDVLRKYDLETGRVETHKFGPGRATGEAVFVPKPTADVSMASGEPSDAEDEGWLISFVYDAGRDTSELVILDAQNFEGEPVAVIEMPRRIPFGFHGNWIPAGSVPGA